MQLYSQPQRVRGLQKSAKADVLFRMLLKHHSKIGICFTSATIGKFIGTHATFVALHVTN